MITPENYSIEHIDGLAKEYGSDRFICRKSHVCFWPFRSDQQNRVEIPF